MAFRHSHPHTHQGRSQRQHERATARSEHRNARGEFSRTGHYRRFTASEHPRSKTTGRFIKG